MAQAAAKEAPKETPGREVRVEISLDSHNRIVTKPEIFKVCKSKDQEVRWVLVDQQEHRFTVDFETNGSPFYEEQFGSDAPVSGLVRRDVLSGPKKYKYTVRLGSAVADPEGVVDP